MAMTVPAEAVPAVAAVTVPAVTVCLALVCLLPVTPVPIGMSLVPMLRVRVPPLPELLVTVSMGVALRVWRAVLVRVNRVAPVLVVTRFKAM